jgi:hypothetical protein
MRPDCGPASELTTLPALPALIYAFGDKEEAGSIWGSLKDEQFKYRDRTFLTQVGDTGRSLRR